MPFVQDQPQSLNTPVALFAPLLARSATRGHSRSSFAVSSIQFSCSVCLTLCDPLDCSTPGLPVHHQLPEFTQTHVHRVGDAIQSSHPLSSPSPPPRMRWPKYWSFSFSISSSNEHPGLSPLGWTCWISLQAKGLSRVFCHNLRQMPVCSLPQPPALTL